MVISALSVVAPKFAQEPEHRTVTVAETIYVYLETLNTETNEWETVDWVHYKTSEKAVPVPVPTEAGIYRIETFPRMSDGRRGPETIGAEFIIK
jgi:hypothetical protein